MWVELLSSPREYHDETQTVYITLLIFLNKYKQINDYQVNQYCLLILQSCKSEVYCGVADVVERDSRAEKIAEGFCGT